MSALGSRRLRGHYGRSGVKVFGASHQGTVYETDLGEDTETLAPRIAAYDPGQGWEEVGGEEALP